MKSYARLKIKNTTRKLIQDSFQEEVDSVDSDKDAFDPTDPEFIEMMKDNYEDFKLNERIYGCGRYGDCSCEKPCGAVQKMNDELQRNLTRCIAMIGAYCFPN